MNPVQKQVHTDSKQVVSGAEELLTALDALYPAEQQQKHVLFAKAYPGIVRAIARKVPQKDILAALSHGGLKLHPVRYREMLEEEHKRRDENGECICCEVCGSTLQSVAVGQMHMPEHSAANSQQSSGLTTSTTMVALKGDEA